MNCTFFYFYYLVFTSINFLFWKAVPDVTSRDVLCCDVTQTRHHDATSKEHKVIRHDVLYCSKAAAFSPLAALTMEHHA